MIQKIFILMLVFATAVSCYQPERDCNSFKKGTFTFTYAVDGQTKTAKFIRGDKFSVDYYDNKVDSALVRWVNDCEFVLKDINSNTAIHYKILSTTKNSYTFEYQNAVKDENKKLVVQKGTATKIK